MSWVCRFCKCTEDSRCNIGSGDTCGRLQLGLDVCTNPKCIIALAAEKRNGKRATEKTRRQAVAPVRESFFSEWKKKREDSAKIRRGHRKPKGRA